MLLPWANNSALLEGQSIDYTVPYWTAKTLPQWASTSSSHVTAVTVPQESLLWNDAAADPTCKDAAHTPAQSCSVYSQALLDMNKGLCSRSSATLQFGKDHITFGSMPELNTALSISSLASHSYDELDLETICFPSACIQLSLGQQSPFQLQPLGMGVGMPLAALCS